MVEGTKVCETVLCTPKPPPGHLCTKRDAVLCQISAEVDQLGRFSKKWLTSGKHRSKMHETGLIRATLGRHGADFGPKRPHVFLTLAQFERICIEVARTWSTPGRLRTNFGHPPRHCSDSGWEFGASGDEAGFASVPEQIQSSEIKLCEAECGRALGRHLHSEVAAVSRPPPVGHMENDRHRRRIAMFWLTADCSANSTRRSVQHQGETTRRKPRCANKPSCAPCCAGAPQKRPPPAACTARGRALAPRSPIIQAWGERRPGTDARDLGDCIGPIRLDDARRRVSVPRERQVPEATAAATEALLARRHSRSQDTAGARHPLPDTL